ncbi:hypothetical protein BG28_13330 [Nesterenkonia sp. AN1]|nr:hypothetical protein BG28_13330 [Nesterenkonia sp. AN1]
MEAIQGTGAFTFESVALAGQQVKDLGVILRRHRSETLVMLGDPAHGSRISGIGLTTTTGVQDPGLHRQRGRHVEDFMALIEQELGMPRPRPRAPSTAKRTSSNCEAHVSTAEPVPLFTAKRRQALVVPSASRAAAVSDDLCGSIPMTIMTGCFHS